jgi:hypothetical protein
MELPQTVEVDCAVVHPDTLPQAGCAGGSLAEKYGLVDQIEYVAHLGKVAFVTCLPARKANGSCEFAWSATASTQSEVPLATQVNTWINAAM